MGRAKCVMRSHLSGFTLSVMGRVEGVTIPVSRVLCCHPDNQLPSVSGVLLVSCCRYQLIRTKSIVTSTSAPLALLVHIDHGWHYDVIVDSNTASIQFFALLKSVKKQFIFLMNNHAKFQISNCFFCKQFQSDPIKN